MIKCLDNEITETKNISYKNEFKENFNKEKQIFSNNNETSIDNENISSVSNYFSFKSKTLNYLDNECTTNFVSPFSNDLLVNDNLKVLSSFSNLGNKLNYKKLSFYNSYIQNYAFSYYKNINSTTQENTNNNEFHINSNKCFNYEDINSFMSQQQAEINDSYHNINFPYLIYNDNSNYSKVMTEDKLLSGIRNKLINKNNTQINKKLIKKLQVKNAVIKYRQKQKHTQEFTLKENRLLKLILKEAYLQGKFFSVLNDNLLDLNDFINKLVLEKPYYTEKIDNTKYSYANKNIIDEYKNIIHDENVKCSQTSNNNDDKKLINDTFNNNIKKIFDQKKYNTKRNHNKQTKIPTSSSVVSKNINLEVINFNFEVSNINNQDETFKIANNSNISISTNNTDLLLKEEGNNNNIVEEKKDNFSFINKFKSITNIDALYNYNDYIKIKKELTNSYFSYKSDFSELCKNNTKEKIMLESQTYSNNEDGLIDKSDGLKDFSIIIPTDNNNSLLENNYIIDELQTNSNNNNFEKINAFDLGYSTFFSG